MRTKTLFCIKCNKELTYETTKLCHSCWVESNIKKFPKCKDCKKQLKSKSAIRCLSCSNKRNTEHSSRFKNKHCSDKHKEKMRKALTGQIRLMLRKEKHYRWKGGITSLHILIRTSPEGHQWRRNIFERDNYTCQECGKKGCLLNADHTKPFSVIFQEFLQVYNQFSPIEDKETLVRLAINYTPFWDIDNGRTLCVPCHKLKTKEDIKNLIKVEK